MIVGIQLMHLKTSAFLLVIRDNSRTPPDLHNGPTGLIFQRISSDSPLTDELEFVDENELVVKTSGRIGCAAILDVWKR